MRHDVPVDPDPEQARRWLEEELGAAGEQPAPPPDPPQWWTDFLDWLDGLLIGGGGGQNQPLADLGQAVGVAIAIAVVVGLIVAAFAIFGVPRLRRRSRVRGDLFGEDDDRSARQIRTAAQQAAATGDYTTAIVELFRSLARDLAERDIVATSPGTTAQEFARRTGVAAPAHARALRDAAGVFDDLRYLGGTGSERQWRWLSHLDVAVRSTRRARAVHAADAFDDHELVR